MRAKTVDGGARGRSAAGRESRRPKGIVWRRVDFSQEVVPEAPAKSPISIYAEETEIRDHAEEFFSTAKI
jgi:hypothetical protein